MAVVKIDVIIFQIPAGKHVNQVKQVRCAKEFGNSLRLLVTVLWTGRRRVSLAARGAMGVGSIVWVNPCPSAAAPWALLAVSGRKSPCGDGGTWQMWFSCFHSKIFLSFCH